MKDNNHIKSEIFRSVRLWTDGASHRLEKKSLKFIAWIIGLSTPLWVYALFVAIGKMKVEPIVATVLMTVLSGTLLWRVVAMNLVKKFGTRKNVI